MTTTKELITFMANVNVDATYIKERAVLIDDCWKWPHTNTQGFGQINLLDKPNRRYISLKAHIASYVLFKGAYEEGQFITQTCGNKSCCNPDHLIAKNYSDKEFPELKKSKDKEYILGNIEKDPKTGCWNWTGSIKDTGYGQIGTWDNEKKKHVTLKAHKVAYELWKGPVPKGVWVLHKCDNRKCVNPDHLFLGNNSDNIIDCSMKGRHGLAKLTEYKVRRIKKLYSEGYSQRDLALKFSVSKHTIYSVLQNKTYRWVSKEHK